MYKKVVIIFAISLFSLSIPVQSFAGERSCLAANQRMTNDMESAASAASAGDACRAADGIEGALNWLGTCEIECAYSKSRMEKIRQTKRDLTSALARYVKLCGH